MSPSKRRLVLAAGVTVVGIGGVLLPATGAMASTTPAHSATVAAPASRSIAATAATSVKPSDYYCEWDAYGNWACIWW